MQKKVELGTDCINQNIKEIVTKYNYTVGLYAIDMYGNEIKYNENILFESASCIKLFILIEYFKQLNNKKINMLDTFEYTEADNIVGVNSGIISTLDYGLKLTSKDYANLMIIYSDNIATNKLIDYLGIENINNTIKELGFKNTKLFNKLDLIKYKIFGQTTPYEYTIAFKKILNNEIFNCEISDQILDILKKQKQNDMLVKGLPQYDVLLKGTDESKIKYIASKSGTIIWTGPEMKNARNDGGIISTIYGEYIVSIFVSDIDDLQFNYDNKGINCGSEINKIIFDLFIKNRGELK
jgi:beta-lactamase class A